MKPQLRGRLVRNTLAFISMLLAFVSMFVLATAFTDVDEGFRSEVQIRAEESEQVPRTYIGGREPVVVQDVILDDGDS